jgi:hypothetical protein
MLRKLGQLAVLGIIFGALEWLYRLVARLIFKLADNAVVGWGDDIIARWFDLKAPSELAVLGFLLEWGPPLVVLLIGVAVYHRLHVPSWAGRPAKTISTFPSPHLMWAALGVHRRLKLSEAIQQAYEVVHDLRLAEIQAFMEVSAEEGKPDEKLAYLARLLLGVDEIELLARTPPSKVHRPIGRHDRDRLIPYVSLNCLAVPGRSFDGAHWDVSISQSDLRRFIEYLKARNAAVKGS